MSLLSIKNLSFSYEDGDSKREILSNISYDFNVGTIYSVIGESGSGKTTLLSLLASIELPQKDNIFFQGEDVTKIGFNKYRRKHVSMVFQSFNLVDYMTPYENLALAMDISGIKYDQEKVYEILESVGLDKVKSRRLVTKLSGGEQQRVAIARAIAKDTPLLIADEPTGNLDEENAKNVIDILKKLAVEFNKCVIVVTHSLEVARYTDVILKIDNSKTIYEITL